MSTESELVALASTTEVTPQGVASVAYQEVVRNRESAFLSAAEFQGYEDVLPGAAERLLSIMEKQAIHRMDIENKVIENNVKQHSDANAFGMVVIFLLLITAIIFGCLGMQAAAIATLSCSAIPSVINMLRPTKNTK
jgi:uncharacterized membrane protein